MAQPLAVELSSRSHDWDDLTELLEALSEYSDDKMSVYAAVQAIAEGESAIIRVAANRLADFTAHMEEFRIAAEVKKH